MWRKLIPVAVVLVAIVAAIVWKMRGGGGETATGAGSGSAIAIPIGPRPAAAPAALSGHVTKAGGGAIAGATVSVVRADVDMKSFGGGGAGGDASLVVVTTDASGAWTADKVAPGRYAIAASAPGFLPGRHDPVALVAGEQRGGIDLQLAPGGTVVRGTVGDVGGGGIPGARVSARVDKMDLGAAFAREAPFVTLADGRGKYELALPDGAFRLTASHDDYTSKSRAIEVRGKPLVVDFTLVPGATIHGQVIARDTGKPVPAALVEVTGGGRRRAFSYPGATADDEGKFVLRHLSSGTVSLSAVGYGYASREPTELAVGIGEEVDGVRVMVEHALSISGRVVKKGTKDGIPGVMVGCGSFSSGTGAAAMEPTDKDGNFLIAGIKPGSYMVFALGEDTMPELKQGVDVTDKDVTGVIVEVAMGATLSGRVDPASKASIGLVLEGDIGIGNLMEIMRSAFVHAETDATGAFTLKHVPAGSFTIAATTDEGPAGKLPVVVTEADQKGLVVTLETRASISGRVIDTNHAPVAGTRVTARRTEDKNPMATAMSMMKSGATTGDDGAFKIVGLEAGKYIVTARDDGDYAAFFKTNKKPDDPIELAPGAERTGVVITVEAKDGVIRGTVIGSDNKPAADAWVTARREDKDIPAKFSEFAMYSASEPVLTNADGKFVIDKLRKGTYTVTADGPRGGSRGEKAGVATGDNITITLAPLGTLSGHLRARAAPITAYDITCRGPAGRVDRHVETQDGAYSLEHLAPGHYDCSAEADAGTANGQTEVPTGTATLELSLVPWASLAGTVVNVLTGAPIAGLVPVATSANDSGKSMAQALFGNGPVTDPTGKFTIDRVGAGSGSLAVFAKTDITKPLATKPFTAVDGQQVDLGTIKVIPPRTGDAGTLGMGTEVKDGALIVTLVSPGGPAAAAGVVVGDVITAIDGKSIADLTPEIAQKVLTSGIIGSGMQVVLELARGATVTLTAAKW
jgi:hypothetical protein